MAPATSSPSSPKLISFINRKHAPRRIRMKPPPSSPAKKYRPMTDIMATAKYAVVENENYGYLLCEQCGSGDNPEELLVCDKCDKGFHMKCVRPIVVRIPIGLWICPKCCGTKRVKSLSERQLLNFFRIRCSLKEYKNYDSASEGLVDTKRRRRRPRPLVVQKKTRRLLPFVPTEDPDRRLQQMASLAAALRALHMEFCNKLTYLPGMAPRSANRASLETGGMQYLPKKDVKTFKHCIDMTKQGKFPPLMVVFDSREGYTVEADDPIKDMTIIAEYTGDVDYVKTRESDDCDSMMTLLLAADTSKSLVICADKRGNIARFVNGINNHSPEFRKKQNCKCVRYCVNKESRVILIAIKDISKGERLYYDYNGYEHAYPTHHFV